MSDHPGWLKALERAVSKNRTETAFSLLQRRHEWDHLEDEDVFADNWYPLHYAAFKGNEEGLRAILRSGCYVDIRSMVSTVYHKSCLVLRQISINVFFKHNKRGRHYIILTFVAVFP